MQTKLATNLLAWVLLFNQQLVHCDSALGADVFSQGNALYAKGDFAGAKALFQEAVTQNAAYWPAQYLLANTYLQLRESELAKQHYEACLAANPSKEIAEYCKKAIEHMNGQTVAANQSGTDSSADEDKPKTPIAQLNKQIEERMASAQRQLEDEKKRILARAESEAEQVKKQAAHRVAELKATGNQWMINPEGELYVTAGEGEVEKVTREAEEKAVQIMEAAQARVKQLQAPKYEEIAQALDQQLKSSKKPALIKHGTNLYVRNYAQENKVPAKVASQARYPNQIADTPTTSR